jgi:hypothetical protein
MEADTKQKLQIAMAVVTLIAMGNTARIFYERRQSDWPAKPEVVENRNLDDYVYLRPSHAHDLKSSAEALSGKTVWVRAGNAVAYYPYDSASRKADTKHQAGVLPPLAQLEIKNVVVDGGQMMAVFAQSPMSLSVPAAATKGEEGSAPSTKKLYAAPVGAVHHGDFSIFIDDIFFLEDPHKLYKHWSAETWSAVERHEIRKGMSEIQASAAMGVGRAVSGSSGDYGNRTLEFADVASGKTVTVTFFKNYASTILEVRQTSAP